MIGFRMRRAEKKAEAGVGRGGAFGRKESWSEMEVVRCPEHGRRSGSEGPKGSASLAWCNRCRPSLLRDFMSSEDRRREGPE